MKIKLSKRQGEIVALMAEGKGNKEIADVLGVSVFTVNAHARILFFRLGGVRTRAQAVAVWCKNK